MTAQAQPEGWQRVPRALEAAGHRDGVFKLRLRPLESRTGAPVVDLAQ